MIVSRDTLRLLIKPDAEVSVACNHVSYGRVYFLSVASCTCVDYRGRTRACTSCAFFVLARKHQLFLPVSSIRYPVSGFPFFPVDVHSLSFSAQTEQNMRLGATNTERSTETLLIQRSSTICYLLPFMSTFCDLVSYTNHLFSWKIIYLLTTDLLFFFQSWIVRTGYISANYFLVT